MIGQGGIQHRSSHSATNEDGDTAMTVELPIIHAGVPRVKVLGVVAKRDGELVADLIEIPVTCQLEHEVREEENSVTV